MMVARNPNPVDAAEILRLRLLIDLFFGPIYMAGIITVLANRMAGLPTTFGEAARAGVDNWARVFAARVVSTFFIILGLFLFIIPAFVLRHPLLPDRRGGGA